MAFSWFLFFTLLAQLKSQGRRFAEVEIAYLIGWEIALATVWATFRGLSYVLCREL